MGDVQDQIAKRIAALDLHDEFIRKGWSWAELDDDGAIVIRGPQRPKVVPEDDFETWLRSQLG